MDDHHLKRKVGTLEMVVAMLLSGSIGLFVIKSGQSPVNIVFFRCLISALCLIPICYFYGALLHKPISKGLFHNIIFK